MLHWIRTFGRRLWKRGVSSVTRACLSKARPDLQLEQLEERTVPAPVTLTWNGPAGAMWNVGANWLPVKVPANDDTLIFNPAKKNTNSVDNINGLDLTSLQVLAGFTSTITFAPATGLTVEQGSGRGKGDIHVYFRLARRVGRVSDTMSKGLA